MVAFLDIRVPADVTGHAVAVCAPLRLELVPVLTIELLLVFLDGGSLGLASFSRDLLLDLFEFCLGN